MKTITATRISGDLYRLSFSDANDTQESTLATTKHVAKMYGYRTIHVDQANYRADGEPVQYEIRVPRASKAKTPPLTYAVFAGEGDYGSIESRHRSQSAAEAAARRLTRQCPDRWAKVKRMDPDGIWTAVE